MQKVNLALKLNRSCLLAFTTREIHCLLCLQIKIAVGVILMGIYPEGSNLVTLRVCFDLCG